MSATFEQWVKAVFDHEPAKDREREWYWGEDFDDFWDALGLSEEITVEYLTRLFRNPEVLKTYSFDQVAQGIWFLIGESSPAQPSHALVYSQAPLEQRVAGIRSIAEFFRKFVVPAAPGPAKENDDRFHGACYMWWDIFPTWGGPRRTAAETRERIAKILAMLPEQERDRFQREVDGISPPEVHHACLGVMEEVLKLPTELCQLSALHGLNHWHLNHAKRVEEIIDAYLSSSVTATPRMREYAARARQGACQ